ncbi:HAD family hydrolase [Mycoplasmopsis caviae]|uniref:HAD family hydrolase n=1 Tax=Mycoplasmopsis caviae TaxID=55603 RepID=A0A3P8L7N0_9BACT|nr:HAD family hydrolase [Mycoplasmopsis caviae]UUD34858.1 HAD family hydrolase [Mycoplasmopsis caviae]VDR42295.1 haloacid dehalogenase-like hydrolase [Mycoplasmopsis caviae]
MKFKIDTHKIDLLKKENQDDYFYINSNTLKKYKNGKLISFYDDSDKYNFLIFEIIEIIDVEYNNINESNILYNDHKSHCWFRLKLKRHYFELSMVDNFVFDMDGTLLNDKKLILDENIKSLNELKSMGKNIIVATGRPLFTLNHIDEVPTDFPIICANGALIYNKDRSLLKSFKIDKNECRKIYQYLKEHDMEFLMYTPDYVLGCKNNSCKYIELRNYVSTIGKNYMDGDFLNELDKYDICKFLIHMPCTTEEKLKNLKEYLKQFNVYLVRSQSTFADIMRKDATKGEAVKFLANKYNLDLNRTICFGDAENDTSMFSISKYSASPASGNINAKSKSLLRARNHKVPWLSEFIEQFKK